MKKDIKFKQDNLYIIIPAYNEEENIDMVVKEWHEVVKKIGNNSKLVVINDGSKDNTMNKLLELQRKYEYLEPLTKQNGGHGDTLLYGYKYAIENKADYIFQTDSDGQTLSSEFQQFWDLRNKYNVILGNRLNREDGKSRKFVEKTLCFILKIIFHVNIPDANAPYRLMKSSTVAKYLNIMPDHYNLPNAILSTCFIYYGEKIKFLPITFRPRQGGVNSINLKKITKIGVKAIKDFVLIKKTMKERKNEKNFNK